MADWILGYAKVCVQNGPKKVKFQKKMLENVLDADCGEWKINCIFNGVSASVYFKICVDIESEKYAEKTD